MEKERQEMKQVSNKNHYPLLLPVVVSLNKKLTTLKHPTASLDFLSQHFLYLFLNIFFFYILLIQ